MDSGGVLAVPCLRGGGEYGESWHCAGMREHKQNVFDDFIAAAEWLIAHGYTCPERLAILGGSNGGLLVAACMVQRPDLFAAVRCDCPLTDMLRHPASEEYGDPAHPEDFRFLHAYSPYHHVKAGVRYPALLVTTADQDVAVLPMHAKKFTAAVQAAEPGGKPILLLTEAGAGHGGGGMRADDVFRRRVDIEEFLMAMLDVSGLEVE